MKNFIILLLLSFSIWCFFFYKSPVNRSYTITPEMKVITDAEVSRVTDVIDQKGFHHAVTDEVENVVNDISRIRDSAKQEVDSITSVLEIEREQLKEWKQYAAQWKDSFMFATRVNDSLYTYSSNNLDIEFVHNNDTPYFNYRYDAKINYASYWSKKNFLSRKRHHIDFWIEDTRVTVNGVKRIKINTVDRNSFEVNAVTFFDRDLSVGFDGQFGLGRFMIGGGYLYNLNDRTWRPIVTGRFKILDF